jgi:phage terminase Nu1 subunit (DNA packaging protein)
MSELLNRRECCALLNCSYAKFKTMLEQGVVPAGIGGGPNTLRWDRDELIKHLQRRVTEQKVENAKARATIAA